MSALFSRPSRASTIRKMKLTTTSDVSAGRNRRHAEDGLLDDPAAVQQRGQDQRDGDQDDERHERVEDGVAERLDERAGW